MRSGSRFLAPVAISSGAAAPARTAPAAPDAACVRIPGLPARHGACGRSTPAPPPIGRQVALAPARWAE